MTEQPARDEGSTVEVVFALPEEQVIVVLLWESDMTARAAADRSGLAERFPQIRDDNVALGVHGEKVADDFVLRPGDRLEICRPLKADPRSMRFEMMSGGRVMGGKTVSSD